MAETGVWALFAFSTHVGLTAASTSDADLMVMDDDADVVDTKCQRRNGCCWDPQTAWPTLCEMDWTHV